MGHASRLKRALGLSAEWKASKIILRATPDPEALKRLLLNLSQKIGVANKEVLQLSSPTYIRLVTEPKTLQFYESDARCYAYWALTGNEFTNPLAGAFAPSGTVHWATTHPRASAQIGQPPW
jgi:hypothetical protein